MNRRRRTFVVSYTAAGSLHSITVRATTVAGAKIAAAARIRRLSRFARWAILSVHE